MVINYSLFIVPVATFVASLILTFGVFVFFPRWGILDRPEKYGHMRAPIPYPGGVSIIIAFLFGVILFFPVDLKMAGFLLGILILGAVSFYDDRKGVHPAVRLLVQVAITSVLIATGTRIEYISNPFDPVAFELPYFLSLAITLVWVIGCVNTTNWLDGVPGVAAGTSTLVGIFLGILSLSPIVDQPELAVLCFTFAAANLGFVFFNIPPPKMLNGDTGAMFSGFVIAVFSIYSGGKIATAFLVLALPLFDAASVIFHRLRLRTSPWKGNDKRHLHDQLMRRGLSEKQVMWLFLFVSLLLGAAALYIRTIGKITLLAVVGAAVFFLSWKQQKGQKEK